MVFIKRIINIIIFIMSIITFNHNFLISERLYGNLNINSLIRSNTEYNITLNNEKIAAISHLDSWYIINNYLYGSVEKNEKSAYLIFDCLTDEYHIFLDENEFKKELINRKLSWKNFMNGENLTKILSKNRDYSPQCIKKM